MQSNDSVTVRDECPDLRPGIRLTVTLAADTSLPRVLELIIKFRKEPDVKDVTWAFVDPLTPWTDHERVLVDQIMWLIGQYAPV
jgi:hypothetical protein